jgi:transcriptional regulator with XRE-family HTH domain
MEGHILYRIKYFREKAGYTQQQLATALDIRQSTVAMWEGGKNSPRIDMLPRIAKILNCTIDDLFGADATKTA